MSGELYDVSETAIVYECQNKAMLSEVDETCTPVNKDILAEEGDFFTENGQQRITVNKLSHMETIKGDTFDKDSAFCSEFTTRL